MDHGNPAVEGADVWFCSDEHLVFAPTDSPGKRRRRFCVGERICVWPAHVDPTMAYHERLHLVDDERVLETWPVDLRGW
jgi:D-serine deaminase-like pyridoxal phosphate-dependent protein